MDLVPVVQNNIIIKLKYYTGRVFNFDIQNKTENEDRGFLSLWHTDAAIYFSGE